MSPRLLQLQREVNFYLQYPAIRLGADGDPNKKAAQALTLEIERLEDYLRRLYVLLNELVGPIKVKTGLLTVLRGLG